VANAKRASMREGPLAALFRKTEAEDESAASEQPAESAPPARKTAAKAVGIEPTHNHFTRSQWIVLRRT